MNLLHELLSNLAVVAIATSIWTFSHRHVAAHGPVVRSLALSLIMTGGVVTVMALPFQFRPGIYLDTRYTFLAISGFFGGPAAAVLPLVAALIRRVMVGGAGLSIAIPHILAASAFGVIGHRLTRGRIASLPVLLGLSFAVAVSGTLGFFWVIPMQAWLAVTVATILPFGSILFGATLLAMAAVVQELRRYATMTENSMYRAVIEALPDCLNAKDLDGRFVVANPATAELMGAASAADLCGKTDFDFYAKETASVFRMNEIDVLQAGSPTRLRQNFIRSDGVETWLSTLKAPLYDERNKLIGLITHNKEITEQRQLELALEEAQHRLQDAVASMPDGLAMFDLDGKLVFRNQRHQDLFPLTADLGRPGSSLRDIVGASLMPAAETSSSVSTEDIVEQTVARLSKPGDLKIQIADGRWIHTRTRSSAGGGVTIVFSDVTENYRRELELEQLNRRLSALADIDGLTGLLNRRVFDETLAAAVADAAQGKHDLSLLMVDVDHFKNFNDAYGHPAGDDCLKKVANAIRTALKDAANVTVARYGGEEISVILPYATLEEAVAIGNLLCAAIRNLQIEHVGSEKKVVTASIGAAALQHSKARRLQDLVRQADEALYRAKGAGRGCVRDLSDIKAA